MSEPSFKAIDDRWCFLLLRIKLRVAHSPRIPDRHSRKDPSCRVTIV